jgi:hypothetical protein
MFTRGSSRRIIGADVSDFLALLDAERTQLQAQDAVAQTEAQDSRVWSAPTRRRRNQIMDGIGIMAALLLLFVVFTPVDEKK